MQINELKQIYTQAQRIAAVFPAVTREATPHVVRHLPETPFGYAIVTYSDLTAENADAIIQEQIAIFDRLQQPFEWKLYDDDRPADLLTRLEKAGFTPEEPEAIMVLPLDEVADALLEPVSHDVRRIEKTADLQHVKQISDAVWDNDSTSIIQFLAYTLSQTPSPMSIYVATIQNQPASCAWIYFEEGNPFASLWGGSTLAKFRGQGLYSALLATRIQEAQARGVRFLCVDASPMSRPTLEKFGFHKIAQAISCKWAPEAPFDS